MSKIVYKNVTLREMLEDLVRVTLLGEYTIDGYYWKDDEDKLQEICEVDLMRDRFCTEDGDFNYYDSELENSRIYREVIEEEEE